MHRIVKRARSTNGPPGQVAHGQEGSRFATRQLCNLATGGSRERLSSMQLYRPCAERYPSEQTRWIEALRWVISGSRLGPPDRTAKLKSGSPPGAGQAMPRLRTTLACILFSLTLLPVIASADLYDEAVRADQEGIPEVSIEKLRNYLAGPDAQHVAEAKLLLAKCLLSTNQPIAALQVLDPQTLNSIAGRSLSAEALLRSGQWVQAETMWTGILADPNLGGNVVEARLGLAEAQHQLGATREALQTLSPLIKDQTLLDARPFLMAAELELRLSDLKGAQDLLAKVNHPDRSQAARKDALSGRLS